MSASQKPPVVMSIAASDNSGGAGIQADLKTFMAQGCAGVMAVTAVTSQNSQGIAAVEAVSPELVESQLVSAIVEQPPRAIKIGVLYSIAVVSAVVRFLETEMDLTSVPVVVDPVRLSTTGESLLESGAERGYLELLKKSVIITPNRIEAEWLLGGEIKTFTERELAARELAQRFGAAILLKGGHPVAGENENEITDILFDGERLHYFTLERLKFENEIHGTGCALSSAIAAGLARGLDLKAAIRQGRDFLQGAIRESYQPGDGQRHLNFGWQCE